MGTPINLNNVVELVNKHIPNIRGKYGLNYTQQSNHVLENLKNYKILGVDKELTLIINTFSLSDKDLDYCLAIFRYCNISKITTIGYPSDNTYYHVSYDVSSLHLIWNEDRLREQLCSPRGGPYKTFY